MANNWQQWEGRTVDGKFLLGSYLGGGSGGSAVFRARIEGEPAAAAIKLVAAEGADADRQLRRWQTASELRHPNLIRIFDQGRWSADGQELLYVVEEYAEENLGQIVPERPLTAEEARAMLVAVLGALECVHGKGLVHGPIRPADIMAADDQIKLASDNLRAAGDVSAATGETPGPASAYDAPEIETAGFSPASDVWSLGMTLVEVLTQHVPAWDVARMSPPVVESGVAEPLRTIASRCLEIEPGKRCGIREILERLESKTAAGKTIRIKEEAIPVATAAARKERAKWPYWLGVAAVIVVAALVFGPRWLGAPPGGENSPVQSTAAGQTTAENQPAQRAAARSAPQAPQPAAKKQVAAMDEVLERVMPAVSPSAQRTIQGTVKVRVRVKVDRDGNVTEAEFKDAGPSKYFARVALEAAGRWKFAPSNDGSPGQWTLLFAFRRTGTEASASRAR